MLYVPNSWAGAASDYYVYYPETTPKWLVFLMTQIGLTFAFMFVNMMGIGLASGVMASTNQAWVDANAVSQGALITAGFGPLGSFGKFCAVIMALGTIANSSPGTYSAALGFQMLGSYPKRVPRWFWSCVMSVLILVVALAGRDHVFAIISNFVALMGYWVQIFVSIVIEEHLLFRKSSFLSKKGLGFDWSAWEDKKRLPIGIAGLSAFLIGWVGAILGMSQVWYVGVLAAKVGDFGADLGMFVGCGFALVVYPPLRMWEVKKFGR
jgi:purine-cytosine permease-like protein